MNEMKNIGFPKTARSFGDLVPVYAADDVQQLVSGLEREIANLKAEVERLSSCDEKGLLLRIEKQREVIEKWKLRATDAERERDELLIKVKMAHEEKIRVIANERKRWAREDTEALAKRDNKQQIKAIEKVLNLPNYELSERPLDLGFRREEVELIARDLQIQFQQLRNKGE